jgi:uncharacterized membrane protein YphA (DoxX/SURF4 family)
LRSVHTVFPDRAAGTGLLLLRAGFAVALCLYALSSSALETTAFPFTFLVIVQLIVSACVLLGLLTSMAIVLSFGNFAALMHFGQFGLGCSRFNTNIVLLFVIVYGLGLALIGPGAYSLDALLFGRREVIVDILPCSRRE